MSGTLKEYKIKKDINLFEELSEKQEQQNITNTNKKGNVGRPKLEIKRKRNAVVLYLYDNEYEKLKEIARLEGLSTFIRGILKDKFNI